MIDLLISIFIMLGSLFMLLSAIGLVRLKNFFQRLHAPTKAATLGLIFLLLAMTLSLPYVEVGIKSFFGIIFFAITAPAGAHLLARAAYKSRIFPDPESNRDDYRKDKTEL